MENFNNIVLPSEAILVKEQKVELKEEITTNGIIVNIGVNRDVLYKVVAKGSEVTTVNVGDILKIKDTFAEDIKIGKEDFKFFSHGDSAYYYIQIDAKSRL